MSGLSASQNTSLGCLGNVDLDRLYELAGSATPGPWLCDNQGVRDSTGHRVCNYACASLTDRQAMETSFANGDYIAAASPNAIVRICDEILYLRKQLHEALEELAEAMADEDAQAGQE